MAAKGTRIADYTPAQGRSRWQQAEAFVMAADLVLSDETDTATPGVAAALAVLAGIAASDAACCAKLQKRPRGHDHAEAIKLLGTVVPHGENMAKDLGRLLAAKDESHYGRSSAPAGTNTAVRPSLAATAFSEEPDRAFPGHPAATSTAPIRVSTIAKRHPRMVSSFVEGPRAGAARRVRRRRTGIPYKRGDETFWVPAVILALGKTIP
jgi:hypothetical protein